MKKRQILLRTFIVLSCSLFIFTSCKRNLDKVPSPINEAQIVKDNKAIVLGKKLNGQPFSVQNVRLALSNIQNRLRLAGARVENVNLQPTHNYYKITPHSVDDVAQLDTLGYEI